MKDWFIHRNKKSLAFKEYYFNWHIFTEQKVKKKKN